MLVFYRCQFIPHCTLLEKGCELTQAQKVRLGPKTSPPFSLHHESLSLNPSPFVHVTFSRPVCLSPSDPFNPESREFIACQRSTCGPKAALNRKKKPTKQNAGTLIRGCCPAQLLRPWSLIPSLSSKKKIKNKHILATEGRTALIIRALDRAHPLQAAYLALVWWDLSNNGSRLQSLPVTQSVSGRNPWRCCSEWRPSPSKSSGKSNSQSDPPRPISTFFFLLLCFLWQATSY